MSPGVKELYAKIERLQGAGDHLGLLRLALQVLETRDSPALAHWAQAALLPAAEALCHGSPDLEQLRTLYTLLSQSRRWSHAAAAGPLQELLRLTALLVGLQTLEHDFREADSYLATAVHASGEAAEPDGALGDVAERQGMLRRFQQFQNMGFVVHEAVTTAYAKWTADPTFGALSERALAWLRDRRHPLPVTAAGQAYAATVVRYADGLTDLGRLVRISISLVPGGPAGLRFAQPDLQGLLAGVAEPACHVAARLLDRPDLSAVCTVDPLEQLVSGSSLGLGLLLALVSAAREQALPAGVVVTGSVNLAGDVCSVSGLKAKQRAALWEGGNLFVYPEADAARLADWSESSEASPLTVRPTHSAADACAQLLPDQRAPWTVSSSLAPLPLSSPDFIGHLGLREGLKQQLRQGGLVLLHGEPGIGKTQVALKVVEELLQEGALPGGAAWVNGEYGPPYAECLRLISQAFFQKRQEDEPPAQLAARIAAYLGARPSLILFDNFETLAADQELLDWLARLRPPMRVLITSRESIPGLGFQFQTPELSLEEAAELFERRATAARWDGRDRDQVRPLCVLVGNHPLSIELLAALAASGIGMERLANRVRKGLAILAVDGPSPLSPRHRSILACFRLSFDQLTGPTRELAMRLAHLPAGSDAQLITAVHGGDDWDLLAPRLVRASILRHSGGRYTFHPLIRQGLLDEFGERRAPEAVRVARAVLQFAVEEGRRTAPAVAPPEAALRALDWLETEWPNLMACAAVLWEEGAALCPFSDAVRDFSFARGHHDETLRLHQQTLALRHLAGDTRGEARTLDNLGLVFQCRGRLKEAEDAYTRSVRLSQASGEVETEARVLVSLGLLHGDLGAVVRAEREIRKGLRLARRCGHPGLEGIALNNLGVLLIGRERRPEAEEVLKQAAAVLKRTGDRIGQGYALRHLGSLQMERRAWAEAERGLREALAVCRACGDRIGMAAGLDRLGVLFERQQLWSHAEAVFSEGLTASREIADPGAEALALINLGRIYQQQGRREEAEGVYRRSLRLGEEAEASETVDRALFALSELFRLEARWEEAEGVLWRVHERARAEESRSREASAYRNLGYLFRDASRWAAAAQQYERAREIWRELGWLKDEAADLYCLGITYSREREWPLAEAALLECGRLWETLGQVEARGASLARLAAVYRHEGKLDLAQEALLVALPQMEGGRDYTGRGAAFVQWGALCARQGRWAEARDSWRQAVSVLEQKPPPWFPYFQLELEEARALLALKDGDELLL